MCLPLFQITWTHIYHYLPGPFAILTLNSHIYFAFYDNILNAHASSGNLFTQ